ncbi:hypothetical protein [Pseudalkalibacillus caeni]|uniref:Uncharacterized protein n=1 Tax=Exobacillus caeni TaxID=2574798 RepID=A0A5R9F770_9BACL|nr:hypothetical protein [Pseudalkalibacillus caeni]TLS38186.1 hypothetical protein FCL54_06510 [Pseudalkalibacillus caeni]
MRTLQNEHKELKESVKAAMFQKERLTETKRDRMLENILLKSHGQHPRKNRMKDWLSVVVCVALLVVGSVSVLGSDFHFWDNKKGDEEVKKPYISAAYIKRAEEIALREGDITSIGYYRKPNFLSLQLSVRDDINKEQMIAASEDVLKLLSHLFKMDANNSNNMGDLWNYYTVEIEIDYHISEKNYFGDGNSVVLKGYKSRDSSVILWREPGESEKKDSKYSLPDL